MLQLLYKKACLQLLLPRAQYVPQLLRQLHLISCSLDKIGLFMKYNMLSNSIPKLSQVFSINYHTFSQIKEAYRLFVGHVFSKAHKSITGIESRSRIKLKLFCCHLINRVFEKEHASHIFSIYFSWLKKNNLPSRFQLRTFDRWMNAENHQKLVQLVQQMNTKFYQKK